MRKRAQWPHVLLAAAAFAACNLPGGIVPGDAPADARTAPIDAGAPDAGAPGFDAGHREDAGGSDARAPAPDASSGDASISNADAGPADGGFFLIGADVSWVPEDESAGARFVDTDGKEREILALLKNHGFNAIRLRTFVDPAAADGYSASGYCDLSHTVAMARRVRDAGMRLCLDLHYSDNWADPGKQCIPVAWQGLSAAQMAQAVHDYTRDVLSALDAAGAAPDLVQIGNEITPGMLIHVCDSKGSPQSTSAVNGSTASWANLAKFLKAGVQAVRESNPGILTVVHLDRGGSASASSTWIKNARANGVQFDVFAESCYVAFQGQPSAWKTTFDSLASSYPDLKLAIAEYNNEAVSSLAGETSMQAAYDVVSGLPAAQGIGTFFWEPTRSGTWGSGLFTAKSNVRTAIPSAMAVYDQWKASR